MTAAERQLEAVLAVVAGWREKAADLRWHEEYRAAWVHHADQIEQALAAVQEDPDPNDSSAPGWLPFQEDPEPRSGRDYRRGTEVLIDTPVKGSGPMKIEAPKAFWPDPPPVQEDPEPHPERPDLPAAVHPQHAALSRDLEAWYPWPCECGSRFASEHFLRAHLLAAGVVPPPKADGARS